MTIAVDRDVKHQTKKSLCLLGNFSLSNLLFADFFKINVLKKILSGTLSEDQTLWIQFCRDVQNIGADLGPNCLQRLSADYTIR